MNKRFLQLISATLLLLTGPTLGKCQLKNDSTVLAARMDSVPRQIYPTQTQKTEVLSIPKNLCGNTLYVQKFAPIRIEDLSQKEIDRILQGDSSNMQDFIETLDLYNSFLYRKFNQQIDEELKLRVEIFEFKMIYARDFFETQNDSVRYLLKPDFSIIEIFQNRQNQDAYRKKTKLEFKYFIYDKQRDVAFKDQLNLYSFFIKLENYQSICKSGELQFLSPFELEKFLTNSYEAFKY